MFSNRFRTDASNKSESGSLEISIEVSCSSILSLRYPIYPDTEVPNHIFAHNLILFDHNYDNSYTARFKDDLAVKYDENGYEYQGVRYDGDYVIMQVIPNPYDNKLSVLVVSTNQEDLLKKHILLRKVIIHTYLNGIHKFWNNEILVYDGRNYSYAYEQNDSLKRIENSKMRVDILEREC